MYAKSIRPSAKREVQKKRSAKRDDQIARPRRAQTCERSELRAMFSKKPKTRRRRRAARDENVPAKRADFFSYFFVTLYFFIYLSFDCYSKDENFENCVRRENKRLSILRLRAGFHLLCKQVNFDSGHIAVSESETSKLSFI